MFRPWNETDRLWELLGPERKDVRHLRQIASMDPEMADSVYLMLRSRVRRGGWDPDDPPKFVLPRDISPSDYIVGTAVSGGVLGNDVGPSDADLDSGIGVFGMTSVGKTTAVKLLLVSFTKEEING